MTGIPEMTCNFQKGLLKCISIIVTALTILHQCESRILEVLEGEGAELDFPYPCNSTKVTLQHGHDVPFYKSANPQHISLSPNQNLTNHIELESDQCFLNLTINPVSRNDEGTYILTAYKNGIMLPDYPRIGLYVSYPPGRASCVVSNDYNNYDDEWFSLRCTAPFGTLPGQIVCYQDDMRLPLGNNLKESEGNLNQIILARFTGHVYCCSTALGETKDKCECKDWGWDPIQNSASTTEPCQGAISPQGLTSPLVFTVDIENSSLPSNLLTTFKENTPNEMMNSKGLIIGIGFLVCIILILSVACGCKARQVCRIREERNAMRQILSTSSYMYGCNESSSHDAKVKSQMIKTKLQPVKITKQNNIYEYIKTKQNNDKTKVTNEEESTVNLA